jgi:eukaryotic-like serine/threonine-protein kinase
MKFCPICKTQYPEDANFCPQETCATSEGPQRLLVQPTQPASRFSPSERIGGGTTGEVWRAIDNQTGSEVAYKVIAPEVLPTQAAFARAEREFKQLMRVSSPKIATIIECEKTPSGGLAVAMELCQGDSLDRMLAAGPMPFEKAKAIVSQVGLALLEAQKVGLVHRDVAPKNVLVAPSGDVKVINFPLAKPINERVAGVADYLSPEQVQGKPVDQRSNTYSLAAIFYHLLTGEPPFQGASEQAVLDMQATTPVLPPTQRRPGAGLPTEADKLVLKAMDKSSSRRHLTLRLFLNELESLKEKPAAAANAGRVEAGLAKTMMFGGNQADIARMVAEARAAKAAASSGTAQPAPSAPMGVPAAPVATPSPAPSGRAFEIGQTIMSGVAAPHAAPHAQPLAARAPAANLSATPAPQVPAPHHQPTPAPFAPTPPPVAVPPRAAAATPLASPAVAQAQPAQPAPAAAQPAAAKAGEAAKSPQKAGSAFRETLWFKQGDVEQMVADAKAKLQAAGKPSDTADVNVDARPLEERYVDDGSVTVEDRKKFSLRTGGTVASIPTTGDHVPGEQMDEKEMVGEISGGRRTLILVIAAVVILGLIVVVAMMLKGKGKGSAALPDTATQTMVAATPQPTPSPGGSPPGRPVPDADVASGGPPGHTAGATAGSAVGTAGGTTKNAVGGATGEAKAAGKKTAPAPKKKPAVVRHPAPKRKR